MDVDMGSWFSVYFCHWVNRVLFSLDLAVTFDLSVCTRIEIGKKWCFRMIKYIKQLNLLSAEWENKLIRFFFLHIKIDLLK